MIRISVAALLIALLFTGPVQAQDLSLDVPVDASAPSEASAPTEDGGGFDLDPGLTISVDPGQSGQIRDIVAGAGIAPVDVDFDIAIGAVVPSSVTLTPVLPGIVALVPGFDGYLFFVLPNGAISIVSPATLKIVLIIYA